MLADRIFGAPERESPKRRKKAPARSQAKQSRAGGAKARGGRAPAPGRARAAGRRISADEARQRRMDLLGLGCLAMAIYLGYVIYLGWNGGTVGNGTEVALDHAVGGGSIVFPVVLALGGLGLILRPLLPSPRALAVGVFAIAAGLLLALAAQTAGFGPDGTREKLFAPEFFSEHGGALGEVLYWASTTLFQRIGAHIIAVLLVVAGVLLVMGRSVSDMIAAALRGFSRVRDGAADFVTLMRESRAGETDPDLIGTDPIDTDPVFGPPEPVDATPVVSRADPPRAEPGAAGVANFDEAVRIEDEPDTEPDAETIRIAKAAGEAGAGAIGVERGERPGPHAPADEAVDVGDDGEAVKLTPQGRRRSPDGVTESEEMDYEAPEAEAVLEQGAPDKPPDNADHERVGTTLLEALGHFGVQAQIVGTVVGPHVSRYELRLAPGTKVSKITALKDDLAYALASTDIRILAPIPGKQAVGVEVPNQRRRLVRLGDIYGGRPQGASPLVAWLGKDISGAAIWTDLQKMPHALIAGTTGSGKSGSVNAILSSILLHASPNEVRLVLVDPKRVELNHYENVPHLLTPVVTSPRLAANVLGNLIAEMESRYGVMEEARARNLAELNKARHAAGEPPLPHILCVIDELADLMMVAPAEVEDAIIRLAQKSRAVGIHLLLATQRPSTDIITGTIKVNIPARIAFAVSSQVDSRVILDQGGAETLLGQGDMLFRPAGTGKLQRIQGAFVTEAEIARITGHWAEQGEPEFAEELLEAVDRAGEAVAGDDDFDPDQDELLEQAARVVVESGTASVSMIQRRLRVGYTRAGRLIDMLERRGIISGYEGSKPRQVLVSMADLPRVLAGASAEPTGTAASRSEDETGERSELAGSPEA
ncbi:MAG TPA: DNA translocase FtsK [Solirubrobacterales bacterium]|jgi:S-DNA-T family DNA segregation ATPase FtsK/SpoIIIE|nr:DNA translocase FtsK [Solirubrobacterales bacterium]